MSKEVLAGAVGGLVGAGLARLTAPQQQRVTSSKQVISPAAILPSGTVTLVPTTTYKFAIMLFHGDGSSDVRLDILKGGTTITIEADKQAIEILANESIRITATNGNASLPRTTPTIEIIALSW
jgi:hypothetical protein